MRIAKLSAQNLIDTFGDNDFFNVVYVSRNALSSVRKQHCLVVQCYTPLLCSSGHYNAALAHLLFLFECTLSGGRVLTYTIYRYVRLQRVLV